MTQNDATKTLVEVDAFDLSMVLAWAEEGILVSPGSEAKRRGIEAFNRIAEQLDIQKLELGKGD